MHLKIFCLCLIIGPTFFQTKSIYYCDYYCSISIFGHEIWNLKKRSQSWMCTLFLPQGGQIKLIFALREAVFEIRAIFKISIFGHDIRNLKKGPKVMLSFCPKGSRLSLLLLYGQPFPSYRQIFKISIFWKNMKPGMKKAWNLAFEKRSESCIYMYSRSTSGGRN